MNYLERSLSFTFGSEGGISDHPADRGGLTNMGITSSTMARAYKAGIVRHNDVRRLTRAEAAKIYDKFYWRPSCADEMPWPLCCLHFDAAVNHGVGGAAMLLQRTLSKERRIPLAIDGAIGPKTKRVLYAALMDCEKDPGKLKRLCSTYLDYREALYKAIIKNRPSQEAFRGGWMNRLKANRRLVEKFQT